MSRRSILSLAASVIIGCASIVTISNDASAYSRHIAPPRKLGRSRGKADLAT
jgi:hypothetical protein